MPQPTASDVHVNGPLTNISVAWMQGQDEYMADKVFPNIPVQKQSDQYFIYDREYWLRTEAEKRAPGTESVGGGYKVSTDNYYADVYAIHKDVDDQIRANTDTPLDADRDATNWVSQQLLLKRDIDWATAFFKTGVWGSDWAGAASGPTGNQVLKWDVSGSDPVLNITTRALAMKKATGYKPNTLVLGAEVEVVLNNHALILDRIKYTERGIVTRALLASLFGVDRVLVASAINNTANEGATESNDWIFNGKSALLCYSAPSPGLQQPSAGYTFSWNGLFGAQGYGTRIKRFRMEHLASDRIEGEMAYTTKVVAPELGTFYSALVS